MSRRSRIHFTLLSAVAFASAACQTYEPRALDLESHRRAWLARGADGPDLASFVASLSADGRGHATFDPSDGLDAHEAELIALVFNAELRLARLRAGVARANAENAGLWEDPTIGVDLTRIIESTPEPWKVFSTVGVTIPISGRLEIEKQRAGAEHAAELARVAQREWAVRMSVRRAWSEWSALNAQLAATRDFMSRVDQVLAVVDQMERAGEMARTEARLFRIEKATKASDLAAAESRAREADLQLRQLMGMSPDAPLRFVHGGILPARSTTLPASAQAADAAELERRSPALLVAAAEHEAAERALELEVRKQYPDLHIGPGYGREDGQDQVLLGLSIPIPVLNANRRGIAEARAQRDVARAGAEAALEQTIAGLHAAQFRLAAATRRREAFESEIVPLVDAQYDDARRMAALGEVNTLVLLESLTRQQDAKVALIAAARDEALAAIDVEELIGPEAPAAAPPAPTPGAAGDDR